MSFLNNDVNNIVYGLDTLTIGSSLPGQKAHTGAVNIQGFNGREVNVMGTTFPRPESRYTSPVLGEWQDLETLSTSWSPNIVVPNADETPKIRKETYADGLVIVYLTGYFERLQPSPPVTPRVTWAANDVFFVLPPEWSPPGTLHFINFGDERQVSSPSVGRRTSGGLRIIGTSDATDKGKYVKELVGVEVSLSGVAYAL